MQYVTDLASFQSEYDSAVTLGKFDALHLGHQKLIRKINSYSGEQVKSIVFAFDMHRDSLVTTEERRELLEGQTDVLIACSFTKEIREMSAEGFIQDVLIKKLRARYVVVGSDFHFGYKQSGDAALLAELAPKYGYHLDVVEKEKYEGREISSTYIRELLQEGNIALANRLLGYTYEVKGVVRNGNHIGRKLGFPTMNIAPPERKIMPRYGVYCCKVQVDGEWYPAIGNVGVKPTVEDSEILLTEVNLFDYDKEAYGKEITVQFYEFERPERKFESIEALKTQLETDILFGKNYFSGNGR